MRVKVDIGADRFSVMATAQWGFGAIPVLPAVYSRKSKSAATSINESVSVNVSLPTNTARSAVYPNRTCRASCSWAVFVMDSADIRALGLVFSKPRYYILCILVRREDGIKCLTIFPSQAISVSGAVSFASFHVAAGL